MTRAEEGLLLLCCPLGDAEVRPLTAARYRALARAAAEGAREADALREVTARDLRELGCAEEEAERIVRLLGREDQLRRYVAAAERRGFFVLTRLSPDYPAALRHKLGQDAPAALFCAGDRALFAREGAALVGSRALSSGGARFARAVGKAAARESLVLVSGGAAGADTAAQDACIAAGGQVVCVLADALAARVKTPPENAVYCAELGWDIPFSAPRALSRNRLIHALPGRALVAQTDCGHGGTWAGTVENLRRGWSDVYVRDDGSEGANALIERGATPVDPDGPSSIRALVPNQTRLF